MLSSRVGEVTKHFPDIPSMFNFGLSTVQFGAVGVFCNRVLQKGKSIFCASRALQNAHYVRYST